ncbi:hypothetical protein NO932_05445 [Pelagibacterium sp. 26DY04]|uniref:hypothetical protein n=1 Tax=Pelagibacterium sp. 26DY04 TaxID=2967130 RepID=UPI002814B4D1|nr:hypothetical protein [Pelagibacterium sp. 26DY04]WMT88053.1 hypothetical protein NO932_05445 [Pelagibacterium sp. 26DY04]
MRAPVLLILGLASPPIAGQEPGWGYSPLPGEGDRAAMGCDREATAEDYVCLAVRCEDDFSVGVHVHSSREQGDAGRWVMTVDRENHAAQAQVSDAPYGARFPDADAAWLEERLRQGTFVYLRHEDDEGEGFRFIDLSGSLRAINTALYYCAPRVPVEQESPGSDPEAR